MKLTSLKREVMNVMKKLKRKVMKVRLKILN